MYIIQLYLCMALLRHTLCTTDTTITIVKYHSQWRSHQVATETLYKVPYNKDLEVVNPPIATVSPVT